MFTVCLYFSFCVRTWDALSCWCCSLPPSPSCHHLSLVSSDNLINLFFFFHPALILDQSFSLNCSFKPPCKRPTPPSNPPPSSLAFVSLPFHLSPALLLLRPPPSPYLLRSLSLPRRAGRVICKCADSCSPSPGFDSAVDVINSSANCDSS